MSDYIDRELAKAYFTPEHAFITPISVRVETLLQAIDNIPAADVAPVKRGKWTFETANGESHLWCSSCGGQGLWDDEKMSEESAYCPHCGARMEGVEGE